MRSVEAELPEVVQWLLLQLFERSHGTADSTRVGTVHDGDVLDGDVHAGHGPGQTRIPPNDSADS
ncbi:MAG: hypothetical protein ACR2MN_13560 [Acidimicrobiales bacterium]